MAGENTVSTLNGLFKVVYADKLEDLIPDFAILQKEVEYGPADKETGSYYAQPVNLTTEGGFTYNGSAGTVVALNAAINGQMKEAQVTGSELILRTQLANTALTRSTSSTKAFKKATAWKVLDMNNSMRKRLECAMLYGQVGVGRVSSVASTTITITDATWSAGIWAGTEGHIVEVYDGITGTDTKRTLGSSTGGTISAVSPDNKTITIADVTGVAAGDYIFFAGARTATAFNEMAGLQKILSNTGTLFNVSASSFSLWKGNTDSTSEVPSHAMIQRLVGKLVGRGLMEKCKVLLSPKAWAVINTDQASLRQFDSSYSSAKVENGSQKLTFHSANGLIEVICHPMVKDGDMFIIPSEGILRIGSVDLSFNVAGSEDEYFFPVAGYNAVELQCHSDQAIFMERPAHGLYTGALAYS